MPIIEGKERKIYDIFSKDFIFHIPPYQRPYSWEEEHIIQLIEDISNFALEHSKNPYFLGSIVLVKNSDEPQAEIIDGQQRLTTIVILFSILRDIIKDTKIKNEFKMLLIEEGSILKGIPDSPRLLVRERDRIFFKKHILTENGIDKLIDTAYLSDSQRKMLENAKAAKKFFLDSFDNEMLKSFAIFFTNHCFLIVVTTSDQDSAYRIFSVLNDRGLQLSHADILKSEIIGKIEKFKQDKYTQKWEDIEENIGVDKFKELFGHIRMITIKKKQKETILVELRNSILKKTKSEDFIDNLIIPYAEAYSDICEESFQSTHKAEEINSILYWLNKIDNIDWIPPAILFFAKHRNNPDDILTFLQKLERLASGMFIRRASVNERIDRYRKILQEIENNTFATQNSDCIDLTDDDKKEIIEKLNGDFYLERKIPKYCLMRLDDFISANGAKYNHKVISVEHVLPQNPSSDSQWLKAFPDDDERVSLTHKLGNLVLLSRRKNSQASNYDFAKKKKKYFSKNAGVTNFALTNMVLQHNSWTPNIIKQRHFEMINEFKKMWGLN